MANFTHSKVLFKLEDGGPQMFHMPPCDERKKLKPLIEHGGGSISNQNPANSIRLLAEGISAQSSGMVTSSFIYDCVKANKLLKMDSYTMRKGETVLTDIDMGSEERNIIKAQAKDKKGRSRYFREEQMKMVEYLLKDNAYLDAKGNAVWKSMETKKITNHSWQSMRDHYHKTMLPRIHTFELTTSQIAKLTNQFLSPDDEQNEIVDVENSSLSTKGKSATSSANNSLDSAVSSEISTVRSTRSKKAKSLNSSCSNGENLAIFKVDNPSQDAVSLDEYDSVLLENAKSRTPFKRNTRTVVADVHSSDEKTDSDIFSPQGLRRSQRNTTPVKDAKETATSKTLDSKKDTPSKSKTRKAENLRSHDPAPKSCDLDNTDSGRKKEKSGKGKSLPNNPSASKSHRKRDKEDEKSESESETEIPETSRESRSVGKRSKGDDSEVPEKRVCTSPATLQTAKRHIFSDDSQDESMSNHNKSHRELRDFFMLDTQEPNSQQDLPEASFMESDKFKKLFKRVCRWLQVEAEQLLDALFVTNGQLKQAVQLILLEQTDGITWQEEEDEILQNGTEEQLKELEDKYSEEQIISRQQFLAQFEAKAAEKE